MGVRERKSHSGGFNLMEVLIALIVLGVISVIYLQMSRYSQKNTGKSIDWQSESVLIEKTIENLRTGHTTAQLRALDSSWCDSTNSSTDSVTAVGGIPDPSFCTIYCDSLAKISITAKRRNFADSISIVTYLFVETP
ncbi:MAG TPA: prepilin-type N-terminal cleavage/methylation domain-containing protein [Fibrobacteria bacterium]|nr:prepilin-type N-terminal cleavage/methylation domain-containing protein [Fibrobacteria bacterium]